MKYSYTVIDRILRKASAQQDDVEVLVVSFDPIVGEVLTVGADSVTLYSNDSEVVIPFDYIAAVFYPCRSSALDKV